MKTDTQSKQQAAAIRPGVRVGRLTVAEATPQRKNGYVIWRCTCDCGGEICLDTRCLQRGKVTDCGCVSPLRPTQKDLTGQRFGRLVCLEPTDQRGPGGGTVWRCRCDCGAECLAVSTQLLHGHKKSCGCISHPPLKDFVGRRFGMLTVLSYAGKRSGMHQWRCRCDCGAETVVGQSLLQSGRTKSCGCLKKEQIRENLRLVDGTSVTILEATKGRLLASNTSGCNGVYRNRRTNKWITQITFKGKTYYLGSYDRLEDAAEARRRGEELYDSFLQQYYADHPDQRSPQAESPTG